MPPFYYTWHVKPRTGEDINVSCSQRATVDTDDAPRSLQMRPVAEPVILAACIVSKSVEPSLVMSPERPNLFWRRLYALLSVSLAVFLFSVIATATAFHGFQFGQAPPRIANHHASVPTAGDLEKADSEYQHARSATVSALALYNAAKSRLDDCVHEQFMRARPGEAETGSASDGPIPETTEPSAAQPTTVGDQLTDDRYYDLQSQVTAAQQMCRTALDRQNDTWQRKVQFTADRAIAQRTAAALRAQTPSTDDGPLRATILWCSLLGITLGAFVCANASAAEKVFGSAADVRQRLGLTVLGLLPPDPNQVSRERREPGWVKHCIRSSELCLLILVAAIAILAITDQQFFTKLLADPVAAVGEKLWC